MTEQRTIDTRSLPPLPADGDIEARLKVSEERERWLLEHFQALSEYLLVEQEDERRQLSRILHDRIGQSLTAAIINLQTAQMSETGIDNETLDLTCRTLSECLSEVREMELNLRPSQLDALGLKLAVEAYLQRVLTGGGESYELCADNLDDRLDAQVETTAFRIIQDLVKLLRRQPSSFRLKITMGRTGRQLRLRLDYELTPGDQQIEGIDEKQLLGIRERIALIMGESTLDIAPANGALEIRLPLQTGSNG